VHEDSIRLWKKVIEDISFEATDLNNKKIEIDKPYVREKVEEIAQDTDLSKYIL